MFKYNTLNITKMFFTNLLVWLNLCLAGPVLTFCLKKVNYLPKLIL